MKAVKSAINGLGGHGLDRCPDQGLDGFKCYVTKIEKEIRKVIIFTADEKIKGKIHGIPKRAYWIH